MLLSIEEKLWEKSLVHILTSPRTEQEIKRWLERKKDCTPEITGNIVKRLKELGYIDDSNYTRMFFEAKQSKMSIRMMKNKLRVRGIKTCYLDELDNMAENSDCDQSILARQMAEKYMRSRVPDEKNLQKLFRYLVGKGFEYDVVKEIVKGGHELCVSG